jgi:hypothetical protein
MAKKNKGGGGGNQGGGTASSASGDYIRPFNPQSVSRIDMGVDYCLADKTKMVAIGDGVITSIQGGFANQPIVTYQLKSGPLAGQYIYYAEGVNPVRSVGDPVSQGDTICISHNNGTCTEIGWGRSDGWPLAEGCYTESDCTSAGSDFNDFMVKLGMPSAQCGGPKTNCGDTPYAKGGPVTAGGGVGAGGGSQGTFSEQDLFSIARAGAFSTYMQLPGLMDSEGSMVMSGAKSVYNDEPIMQFVQQLCQASLRQFQSLPNGAFFAFFPDQFGLYGHRKPYWAIEDIEIVDGGIDLTDESLVTHLFVVGDTNYDHTVDLTDAVNSTGVVTIFDYFGSSLIVEPKPKDQKQTDRKDLAAFRHAAEFLRKYGQRPLYQPAPFITNSFFEIFYAYTQFETLWANQFRTTFSFTFMPELYPGGRVAFPDHDIQCYIDSVTHTFDYESGFITQANLSAPSATKNSAVTQGMLAPFTKKAQPFLAIDPNAGTDGSSSKSGGKGGSESGHGEGH